MRLSVEGRTMDAMKDILNYKKPGAAAALSYFVPGLGHMYVRDYSTGAKWLAFYFVSFPLFLILWIAVSFLAAIIFLYAIYMVLIPIAYKTAYSAADEFNRISGTHSGDMLEDPSTAFMMTVLHPGLGHLYIGEVDQGVTVLRISVTVMFIPLLFIALDVYAAAVATGILCGFYIVVGSFFFGRSAYNSAKQVNLERQKQSDNNQMEQ